MSYSSLDPQADRPAVTPTAHPDSNAAKRDLVVAVVAKHAGVSADAIMGPSRLHSITTARHLAFLLFAKLTGLTFQRIGEVFGRNHGTVIKGIVSVGNLLETEPPLRKAYVDMRRDLNLPAL